MTRKTLTLIITLITALIVTPAAAQGLPTPSGGGDGEPILRGYAHERSGVMLIAMQVPGESDAEARLYYSALSDPAAIEDALNLTILDHEALTGDTLKGVGSDMATLYMVLSADNGAGLMLVAQDGEDVFLFLMLGNGLDGEQFAEIVHEVIAADGIEDMDDIVTDRPGWVAVPLDDEGL